MQRENEASSGDSHSQENDRTTPNITPEKSEPVHKRLISTLAVIIAAPIIAVFLVVAVFQVYEVDGQSMSPTLMNKDRLIVLKLPKTWGSIVASPYVPERYDIVVFKTPPESNGISKQRELIKRVIGLPGDRVVIEEGEVRVFNDIYPAGLPVDKEGPQDEVVNNTSGNVDLTIPEGEIFLLGDNRNNSSDSRVFGSVPVENIIGKLSLRFYPFDSAKKF